MEEIREKLGYLNVNFSDSRALDLVYLRMSVRPGLVVIHVKVKKGERDEAKAYNILEDVCLQLKREQIFYNASSRRIKAGNYHVARIAAVEIPLI